MPDFAHIIPVIFAFIVLAGAPNAYGDLPPDASVTDTTDTVDSVSSDAVLDPCGAISHEGCCAGNTVFYCLDSTIKTIDCSDLQGVFTLCGWRASDEIYDCGTDGMAAPGDSPPYLCEGEICTPDCDGKTCGPDGCGGSCGSCQPGEACTNMEGQCETLQGCGEITAAGCCDGSVLRFCGGSISDPKLQEKDCDALDLNCGWSTEGSWYDCGLEVREDPSGTFSRQCPDLAPPCIPDCSGKSCGDDGCWGSCGECGNEQYCSPDQTCTSMTPPDISSGSHIDAENSSQSTKDAVHMEQSDTGPGADVISTPPKKIIRNSCDAVPVDPIARNLWFLVCSFAVLLRLRRKSAPSSAKESRRQM